jgi:hypothetical protein
MYAVAIPSKKVWECYAPAVYLAAGKIKLKLRNVTAKNCVLCQLTLRNFATDNIKQQSGITDTMIINH